MSFQSTLEKWVTTFSKNNSAISSEIHFLKDERERNHLATENNLSLQHQSNDFPTHLCESLKKMYSKEFHSLIADASIDLQGELKEFYSCIQFDRPLIIGDGLYISISPIKNLVRCQEGWRFISDIKTGLVSEDTVSWNKNWIVFADINDDAIYVKQDIPTMPIYGCIQTEEYLLANSLNDFFCILIDCYFIEEHQFKFETKDDDFSPKTEYIEAVKNVVKKYSTTEKNVDDFMAFFFG